MMADIVCVFCSKMRADKNTFFGNGVSEASWANRLSKWEDVIAHQVLRPFEWYCTNSECAVSNFHWRDFCHYCGEEKPGENPPPGSMIQSGGNHQPVHNVAHGDWKCSAPGCDSVNFAKRVTCFKCNASRSSHPSGGSSRGPPVTPSQGDWVCNNSACGNVNFARRQQCHRCGEPRNEHRHSQRNSAPTSHPPLPPTPSPQSQGQGGGERDAPGQKGYTFCDGDWICSTCGNCNFARRMACHRCSSSRPHQGPPSQNSSSTSYPPPPSYPSPSSQYSGHGRRY